MAGQSRADIDLGCEACGFCAVLQRRFCGFDAALQIVDKDSIDRRALKIDAADRRAPRRPQGKELGESDRIRDELAAMGVAIKDNKDGTTTWEVKR